MELKEELRKRLAPFITVEEENYLVIVRRRRSLCGFEFQHVKEVVLPQPLKRLPFSPPFLKGIFSHLGTIVPVIELSEFLQVETPEMRKVLILLLSDGYYSAGIFINDYPVFKKIQPGDVFSVEIKKEENRFVKGFVKEGNEVIPVVNLSAIFEEIRRVIRR